MYFLLVCFLWPYVSFYVTCHIYNPKSNEFFPSKKKIYNPSLFTTCCLNFSELLFVTCYLFTEPNACIYLFITFIFCYLLLSLHSCLFNNNFYFVYINLWTRYFFQRETHIKNSVTLLSQISGFFYLLIFTLSFL